MAQAVTFDLDGRPTHVTWAYTRAEVIADGIIHGLGITFAICGATALIVLAALHRSTGETVAVSVYGVALVMLFGVSAAYNLWPISRTKWWLRRFDHACIFVLIAATYTPFLTQFPSGPTRIAMFAGVWAVALMGAVTKILLPGRYDRVAIGLYLALGLSGAIAWEPVTASLSSTTLTLIVAGGLVYAAGIVFHLWEGLRFQNAVWHGFVLLASVLFYVAVLNGVVLS